MHEFQDFGWRPEEVPDPQLRSSFEASKLDWSEPEREPHRSLLELHRSLIRRRRRLEGTGLEVAVDEAERTLTMTRGGVQVHCDFQGGKVSVKHPSEGKN